MYACRNDTPTSKNNIAKNPGTSIKNNKLFDIYNIYATLAIICTKVWPANIFALNLIAKLNDRKTYDTNSIMIIIGIKNNGTSGTNKKNHFIPKLYTPTKNIPEHKLNDKYDVHII
jgi:hypothetical protein